MKRIARFEKVSLSEYEKAAPKELYESIKLPARATAGSAGYDFFAPESFSLAPSEKIGRAHV